MIRDLLLFGGGFLAGVALCGWLAWCAIRSLIREVEKTEAIAGEILRKEMEGDG